MKVKGTVYKLKTARDDINSEHILSGKYKFHSEDRRYLAGHLFEDIEPDFAESISRGDILVVGHNFGCGFTREHACQAMVTAGIQTIIAKSFAQVFYRMAFNNGLLLLECNTDHIEDRDELEIDLKNNYIRVLTRRIGLKMAPLHPFLLKLFNDGGLISHLKKNELKYNL